MRISSPVFLHHHSFSEWATYRLEEKIGCVFDDVCAIFKAHDEHAVNAFKRMLSILPMILRACYAVRMYSIF
jgi:hypothetical protein